MTLTERSLITGEEHMTTLQLEDTGGMTLGRSDAMSWKTTLARGQVSGQQGNGCPVFTVV